MHFYLERKNDIKYVLRWHSVYSPILRYCKVLYLATDWLVDYVELSRCLVFLFRPSSISVASRKRSHTNNQIGIKAWCILGAPMCRNSREVWQFRHTMRNM